MRNLGHLTRVTDEAYYGVATDHEGTFRDLSLPAMESFVDVRDVAGEIEGNIASIIHWDYVW